MLISQQLILRLASIKLLISHVKAIEQCKLAAENLSSVYRYLNDENVKKTKEDLSDVVTALVIAYLNLGIEYE